MHSQASCVDPLTVNILASLNEQGAAVQHGRGSFRQNASRQVLADNLTEENTISVVRRTISYKCFLSSSCWRSLLVNNMLRTETP